MFSRDTTGLEFESERTFKSLEQPGFYRLTRAHKVRFLRVESPPIKKKFDKIIIDF